MRGQVKNLRRTIGEWKDRGQEERTAENGVEQYNNRGIA